jgi:hypothetical protein
MQVSLVSVPITAWHFNVWDLMDHVTLNFNNNMSMAAVFLDIEKTCDTRWHLGLLYKLSKLKFVISLINPISSSLSQRKFKRLSQRWTVYAKEHKSWGATSFRPVPHTVQYIYINDMPPTPGVFLDLPADDTYIYVTECKVG